MTKLSRIMPLLIVAASIFCNPLTILAGPPFVTDGPATVEYQHWELYAASQPFKTTDGWSGAPVLFEVNYPWVDLSTAQRNFKDI